VKREGGSVRYARSQVVPKPNRSQKLKIVLPPNQEPALPARSSNTMGKRRFESDIVAIGATWNFDPKYFSGVGRNAISFG